MGQRLIITEEEKKHILGLHKSNIFEAGPYEDTDITASPTQQQPTTPTQQQPTTPTQQQPANTNSSSGVAGSSGSSGVAGSSGSSGVAGTIVNSSIKNSKVQTLQSKLNEKFKSALSTDSRWGPKTATAVLNALKSLEVPQEVQTQQTPQTQEPIQYLPKFPAGTVQRPSQPAQLAGQK